MTVSRTFRIRFPLSLMSLALVALSTAPAFATDVLSPAHCKVEQDFKNAHSRSDDSAWDMYQAGGITMQVANDTLTVSATFNFSKCAELAPQSYGWKLFNESRKTTDVVLIGEEVGWFGISHIHTSSPGEINLSTGRGASSFTFDEFLNTAQKSAVANHETVHDAQVVLVADQDHTVAAGYTGSNGIASEGLRLSFDLVPTANGYKVVRK